MNPKYFRIVSIPVFLMLASLACSLGGGRSEVEPPAPALKTITAQAPTAQTEVNVDPAPQASPQAAETAPQKIAGLEPGWHIYSNANYVNGIALHDNTLWAATLGGVVAWDLRSGEATKYTPLDGMGHISIYDIVVCPLPELRVVAATEKGLNFFDPAAGTWSAVQITPEESYVGRSKIGKLFCDQANNRLLIGYSGLGVLDLAGAGWQQFTDAQGLATNSVYDIEVHGAGIWSASYKGASVIQGGAVTVHNESSGMPEEDLQTLAAGQDGSMWLGSSGGLLRFQDGAWKLYNRDNVANFPGGTLYGLAAAPDGTLWAANYSGELCHFDPNSESCVNIYPGQSDYRLTDLKVGADGSVYYATYGGGIHAFEGGIWKHLSLPGDRLASNFVEDFGEDADGLLWIATDSGAQRIDPADADTEWPVYKASPDGPPSTWFQSVFPQSSGVWFVHDSNRASFFDGSAWTPYGTDQGMQGSTTSIAVDSSGGVWIGSSDGVNRVKDGAVTLLSDADGLPGKSVRALFADGDTLWVGTTDGLARIQNMQVEVVLTAGAPGLPDDNIAVIAKDAHGNLLLGTTGGLARFDGSQAETILIPEAISGLFGEAVKSISDIALAADGSLWVGTYGGLYHGDGENWQRFTTADGLPTNNINAVYVDRLGTVWIGGGYTDGGGGIARYVPGEPASASHPQAAAPTQPAKPTNPPEAASASTSPTEAPQPTAGSPAALRQWAIAATASSQYGDPDWSASQATGAPDTLECGDTPSAWASENSDSLFDWLELRYATPVLPSQVNIIQSFAPSQVARVELLDTSGKYHEIYMARPKSVSECPYTLSISVENADYQAVGVKLYLDQTTFNPTSWNEIDAVELVGQSTGASSGAGASSGNVKFDKLSGLPILPDAEELFSREYLLNYWTYASLETARDFYLSELPKLGWLLDLDENGKCRDNNRCMGWHGGYDDPTNTNWFFIQGEHAYLTMNLIEENGRLNIVISIDPEYK